VPRRARTGCGAVAEHLRELRFAARGALSVRVEDVVGEQIEQLVDLVVIQVIGECGVQIFECDPDFEPLQIV
jgi:hypothetical protein